MKGAWERFYSTDALNLNVSTFDSWASGMVTSKKQNSNVPEGSAADAPPPAIYPDFAIYDNAEGEVNTSDTTTREKSRSSFEIRSFLKITIILDVFFTISSNLFSQAIIY